MTINEFDKLIQATSKEVHTFLNDVAPRIAGKVAIKHAKQNFQKESFEGEAWKEVQRRIPSSSAYRSALKKHKARTTRKILTGDTGDLGRSIKATYSKGEVEIFSDKVYAKVHNEGLKAGRGAGFQMPKRQFIGESEELTNDIKKQVQKAFKKLFKNQ